MRKEQRDYIINKLRGAVRARMDKESKGRPVAYTKEEVVAYLADKGVEVTDAYYAMRYIKMPPLQAHADNRKYLDSLNSELMAEVVAMETALMLSKDPDAVAMLNAALERIKGD